jgi:hypothetical protein
MIITVMKYLLYGLGLIIIINILFHWFASILSLYLFKELEKRMISTIKRSTPELINPVTGLPDVELAKKYMKRKK